MRTKPIIVGAVLIAILLLISILFMIASPSPPPITVCYVNSVRSVDSFTATFEFTNHTARSYLAHDFRFEAQNGSMWRTCSEIGRGDFKTPSGVVERTVGQPSIIRFVDPHVFESWTFVVTNIPTGVPLRLRVVFSKKPDAPVEWVKRLELWFQSGHKGLPPNPFDKNHSVFAEPKEFVSDEFVEPDSHQADQGVSEQ